MTEMKKPTIDDVLAFVPKGRSVSPRSWLASMTSDGFDPKLCQRIMQQLLDPEHYAAVTTDHNMHFVLTGGSPIPLGLNARRR